MRTQTEFFAALAKCRNGWTNELSEIRRGQYCPITAVASSLVGEFDDDDYLAAAKAIGISESFAERVVAASDWISMQPVLRKRILAALGLSE